MHNSPLAKSNWRVYPLTTADQQQHIEQSELLLSSIQPGDAPILYWSQAVTPGLVLGFSQKPTVLNQAELLTLPIYHRRAGGTAVLVGPSLLSLDVVLPAGHPLVLADIVESYRWLGQAWVTTLQRLGVLQVRAVPPAEAHAQRALRKLPETSAYELLMNRACYGTLSPYEVVVGQRKVVGLDMIRRRAGSLLQAGVLLSWQPAMLARLLGQTEEEQELLRQGLPQRAIGLDALVDAGIATDAIMRTFEETLTRLEVAGYSTTRGSE